MGNIIVVLILAAAVALAVRTLRKSGGSTCGCGCENCGSPREDCARDRQVEDLH